MRKIIANTTPLIALANVGILNILHELYDEIMIPPAVMDAIKSKPTRALVEKSDRIKICPIADDSEKRLYRARLHAGEVEVMILAGEQKADLVIIDDNTAKKMVKYMGLKVTGTLGVLLRDKCEDQIDAVKLILSALAADGMYISDQAIAFVLEEVGEVDTEF